MAHAKADTAMAAASIWLGTGSVAHDVAPSWLKAGGGERREKKYGRGVNARTGSTVGAAVCH